MEKSEDTRVALIGIIVEDDRVTPALNDILHAFGQHIIGRIGVPYRSRGICVISIIVDAPNGVVSSLSGKLGMLEGVNVKTMYAKV